MKDARRVLILNAAAAAEVPDQLRALAESMAAQGAVVVMRRCDEGYELLLDEIADADSVVFWP